MGVVEVLSNNRFIKMKSPFNLHTKIITHFTDHLHAPSAKSFACVESLMVIGFL